MSKHWREKYHIPWTCLPEARLGVFQLCLWPLIAPGYPFWCKLQPGGTLILAWLGSKRSEVKVTGIESVSSDCLCLTDRWVPAPARWILNRGNIYTELKLPIVASFFSPFSALTLLSGWQEGHPACKTSVVGLLVMTSWLELCTSYSSSCHHHFHHP